MAKTKFIAICTILVVLCMCVEEKEETPITTTPTLTTTVAPTTAPSPPHLEVDVEVIPEKPKFGDEVTIIIELKGGTSGGCQINVSIGKSLITRDIGYIGESRTLKFEGIIDTEDDIEIRIYDMGPTEVKTIFTKNIPVAPPPWQEEGNYIRDFEWGYKGYTWTWELIIPKSTYNYYHQMERPPLNEIGKYIIEDESGIIEYVAEKLEGAMNEKGFDKDEKVGFLIAFVQSLPYYPDDVSTGHDEWPKFPIETLADGGGDCEDTSILVAAVLNEWNYGVVLLGLPDHMAIGIWCGNCYGSYITYKERNYFYLETTGEGWGIGDIPPEYKDASVTIYDIGFSLPGGSKEEAEERTGNTGGNLMVMDIINTNTIFYIWIKNATGYDLGSGDVSITIKNSSGNIVIKDSAVGDGNIGEKGIGNFLGGGISNSKEGQITATNSSYTIVPGETYTIIITARGITTTEKYTAH